MPSETVVLVHGIWMSGLDLLPLSSRLGAEGFDARIFRYPSLRATPAENAAALGEFVRSLADDPVHLVGHSLGGIVILHALRAAPALPPGRIALLGSPVHGSAVARVLAGLRLVRPLVLGRSTEEGLLGDAPRDVEGREVLTLAGSQPLGLGRMVTDLPEPHDGTVAVEETRLEHARSCVLPVSHTGMLLSREVATCVARFLRTGEGGSG
jgi:pimeloyl-ACP methyl ester carboxylesterase